MAVPDTNVVARLVVADEIRQGRAAENLVASEPCTIAASVLMECEWVLRGGYKLEARVIPTCFRDLLALEHIDTLDPVLVQRALQGYEAGLDFADALHAAQRRDGDRFATLDKRLARRAPRAGVPDVALLKA
jgi:predicted nucleic-acid-binding protein